MQFPYQEYQVPPSLEINKFICSSLRYLTRLILEPLSRAYLTLKGTTVTIQMMVQAKTVVARYDLLRGVVSTGDSFPGTYDGPR